MKKINVNEEYFQEIEIKGHYGIFTEYRIDKSTIPEGINCYEFRHGDDDSYPATLEREVYVNYFGAVLMVDNIELEPSGYIELSCDDWGFTSEVLTMLEYKANYEDVPEYIITAKELIKFLIDTESSFPMMEKEADVLLGYLERHDFMLGQKEGKLLRGDLRYEKGKIRWLEDTIENIVIVVSKWEEDLLEETEL